MDPVNVKKEVLVSYHNGKAVKDKPQLQRGNNYRNSAFNGMKAPSQKSKNKMEEELNYTNALKNCKVLYPK
jgi:hypothetical protein